MIKTIKKKFENLSFIDIFLMLNPIIDLTTTFSILVLKIDISFGIVMRSLFLLFIIMFYLIRFKKGRLIIIYSFFLIFYSIIFFFDIVNTQRITDVLLELKAFAKIFYFPVLLTLFWAIFKNQKTKTQNLDRDITVSGILYSIFIYFPVIFGVSLLTYGNDKDGFIGWFFAPNEIGAILGIISPILIYALITSKKQLLSIICLFLYIVSIAIIGTKGPVLALIMTLIILFLTYSVKYIFNKNNEDKKRMQSLLIIGISFYVILTYFSPLNNNLEKQKIWQDNQQNFTEPITTKLPSTNSKTKQIENSIINNKLINMIFSSRQKYAIEGYKNWENSDLNDKLFGLGVYKDKVQKTVEIDFLDILYSYGIFGYILYFLPILLIVFNLLYRVLFNFKEFFRRNGLWIYSISLILALGISMTAGHVLTAPAVSIFVAIVASKIAVELNEIKNLKQSSANKKRQV